MNIFEKMQIAKEKILKANLKKSGRNNFAGYTYYELGDLLPTIIQVCKELKLFTQVTFDTEFAILKIINIEEPNEQVSYTSPMKDLNLKGANEIQALGGVETYQRRYLYMSAFDIVENDMFDGAVQPMEQLPTKAKKATIKKLDETVAKYVAKNGGDSEQLVKMFVGKVGATSKEDLTDEQAKKIISAITSKL